MIATFKPTDYEVFGGLDVDKRSISVTFTTHQGFIRSLRMPYSVEHLVNHVRKHLPIRRWPLPTRLDQRATDCMMGGWRKPTHA